RPHVEKPVKTGTGSRSTSPGYVGQLGQKQGSHITRGRDSDYRGEPMHVGRSFNPVPFGNEVALNVGPGGCGTGRTIYKTGSQGMTGQPASGNPPAKNRDILSSYGPESKPRGNPGRSSDTDADF